MPESGDRPAIEIIKPVAPAGANVGVFASSFNPVTIAHSELVRRAAAEFTLDEVLALAGRTNADKTSYDCPLEDRLTMLGLAFGDDPHVSIGVSSHAFYVDMLDGLAAHYPKGDLHFVVGFDTFERVLDRSNRYTARYHRRFADRAEALGFLFARSRFIVAARGGAGLEHVRELLADEPPEFGGRVSFLDFPADLGERSATEVRERRRAGHPIEGLVPDAVAAFIAARGLYR